MPRDYRRKNTSRSRSRASTRSSSGSLGWAAFGLVLGLLIAILIYWKHEEPSATPQRTHAAHNKEDAATANNHPVIASTKKPEKAAATSGPEFDFYTVLPKMQVSPNNKTVTATAAPAKPTAVTTTAKTQQNTTTGSPAKSAANVVIEEAVPATATAPTPPGVAPPKATTATAPTNNTIASTTSAASGKYFLQMASLKNYADADRYKAQLTMMGFDVTIHSYTLNGQVYNRIVLGPYNNRQTAMQQQTELQKNHIASILIKSS